MAVFVLFHRVPLLDKSFQANHDAVRSLEEARLSVFRYIETFYNSQRIHETLGYLTPNDYEAENAPAVAA